LGPWIKEWGPELVLYAFKLAYENSVEMQGLKKYVQAILNNWTKRDIKTLEDAEKARKMFEEQKKAGRSGDQKKPGREEKLPNWEGMQEDVPLSDEEQANLERQMQELLGG
ncbi:DnaD domain protein, partial [Enterococcus faecalis]